VSEPRRVGLVIGQLTVGGAEGQLAHVVQGLRGRFEPFVFSLGDAAGALHGDLVRRGATVDAIAGHGIKRARNLTRALREKRIDLVHSWLFIANGYALAARLLGVNAPLVTSARNCKVQGRASQIANAAAFRASKAIVVNSAEVGAYIREHYWAPADRIRLVQNGIDTERFHPLPETGVAGEPGPIVSIGRLVPQKNHELFLRAAAELAREFPRQRFIIVGDGPLRADLERQATELKIADRVTFTGERRDVDVLLRDASLFWLTSRWEGMPNVVLEALSSGVPAIATDISGTRELIGDGREGFIVASGDASAFVARSRELLADAPKMAAFRLSARARAHEFSIPRMIESLCAVYDEALAGR
jgi:glycosyltransferase involved in cell wall biosynthesis